MGSSASKINYINMISDAKKKDLYNRTRLGYTYPRETYYWFIKSDHVPSQIAYVVSVRFDLRIFEMCRFHSNPYPYPPITNFIDTEIFLFHKDLVKVLHRIAHLRTIRSRLYTSDGHNRGATFAALSLRRHTAFKEADKVTCEICDGLTHYADLSIRCATPQCDKVYCRSCEYKWTSSGHDSCPFCTNKLIDMFLYFFKVLQVLSTCHVPVQSNR